MAQGRVQKGIKEATVDRNPTVSGSGAFARKASKQQAEPPKMLGSDSMGYARQTSKFKSVFGEAPKPTKGKKYQGASRKPVSFFEAHKNEGGSPGKEEASGDEEYQINIDQ
jgi:hypothetical protein